MDDLKDVLILAYRLVDRDRPAAIRSVYDKVDVFHNESLQELGPLAFNRATDDTPSTRAAKLTLLGDLFFELTEGPVAVFRDLALLLYDAALSVDRQSALLLLKSGTSWLERINGDREYNLGRAIQQLDRCLKIALAEALRIRGQANNQMALALSEEDPGGEQAAFREAEAHFNEALRQFQQLRDESLQAMVHLNLGNFYASASHPPLAISHYRKALDLYIRLNQVGDIALTERNLGVTLLDDTDQPRSEDIEEGIRYLKSSLSRIEESHDPHGFAATLNDIGKAYALRIAGNEDENFAVASDAFERAAARFAKLGEIANSRIAYVGAGGIRYELKQWAAALRQFKLAIDQLECEWQEKLTAQSRLQLDRQTANVFDFAVLSAMNDANRREALYLLEQGRQKLLIEAYYSKGVHPRAGRCSELWQRAENLRHQRASLEQEITCYRLRNSFRTPSIHIEKLHKEVEDLRVQEQRIIEAIKTKNPGFLPTAAPLGPDEIAALAARLNANFCVVKPTAKGTIVFAFTPDGKIRDALIEHATVKYWQDLLFVQNGWVPAYKDIGSPHPFPSQRLDRWLNIMNSVLNETFRELIAKCLSLLSLSPVGPTETLRVSLPRLYFLAGGPLELLPLHAAFWEDSLHRRYLADIADVGYFSSFRLLAEASERLPGLGVRQKLTILRAPERERPFM